jgi:hypothetical protein
MEEEETEWLLPGFESLEALNHKTIPFELLHEPTDA